MLKIGDVVFVQNKGVCRVDGMDKKDVLGNGVKDYYVMKPVSENSNMTIYVPTDTKLKIRKLSSKEKALKKYHALFNGSYFPLSQKKQCLALDFTVGEVFHYLLFGELFIDQKMFEKSYRKVCDSPAKTKYGIKIVAAEDGSYAPLTTFQSGDYLYYGFATMAVGCYQNGGSWHLYEMLFHIAGHLHGMLDAQQNLIDRLAVDLRYGGATYEYMHTIKGNGVKANQGWNASVYAIWEELIARGVATDRFFREADAMLDSYQKG